MSELLIEAELTKRYGVREVLKHARISVKSGTVHALVGENGAGKSTLVKILAGVVRGDGGQFAIDGKQTDTATWNRTAARAAGIGIVQQHGAFAGTLSVVENAVLGVEPRRRMVLDLAATAKALGEVGARVGLPIDPWARADQLSLGQAQRAELVAALYHGARLLILDEPTAVLTPIEVDGLLATLRRLATDGTSIVIVTHKLDEVRAVADEVTVLRAGATVATFTALGTVELSSTDNVMPAMESLDKVGTEEPWSTSAEAAGDKGSSVPKKANGSTDLVGVLVDKSSTVPRLDVRAIARAMVGANLPVRAAAAVPRSDARAALVLGKVGVGAALREIDLEVRGGEIVGVAGVDGNGQRELALAIAGLVPHTGHVAIGRRDVTGASPAARLAAGLAHIPEDRHHGGLVLDLTVAENLAIGRTDVAGRFFIDRTKVRRFAQARIAELDIRPDDAGAVVSSLSGGNQQKVVVGRELSRPALAAVVAAQPTRGVDLGAVALIHDQIRAAAEAGAGVLVISADLDELLALCHRIVVMLRGQIVGELGGAGLRDGGSRTTLGTMMTGAEVAR